MIMTIQGLLPLLLLSLLTLLLKLLLIDKVRVLKQRLMRVSGE